jgi:hypothetical protein
MNHIPLLIKDKIFWAVLLFMGYMSFKIKEGEIKINKEASLQLQYLKYLKRCVRSY